MTAADYLILVVSFLLIANVLLLQSDDDGMNSFTGVASEQYKNRKMQGSELFLNRAMFVLTTFFFAFIFWSNAIDRLFL